MLSQIAILLPFSDSRQNQRQPGQFKIKSISEVRTGHSTDAFNALAKKLEADRPDHTASAAAATANAAAAAFVPLSRFGPFSPEYCLSVVFKDSRVPLDLVAESRMTRDLWVEALNELKAMDESIGRQKEHEECVYELIK